jgi:hypothetical protein
VKTRGKIARKHNYNDYEPDYDICYDQVVICNKKYPYQSYEGWKGGYDCNSFIFERVDLESEECETGYMGNTESVGYVREILSYKDWEIRYL